MINVYKVITNTKEYNVEARDVGHAFHLVNAVLEGNNTIKEIQLVCVLDDVSISIE